MDLSTGDLQYKNATMCLGGNSPAVRILRAVVRECEKRSRRHGDRHSALAVGLLLEV